MMGTDVLVVFLVLMGTDFCMLSPTLTVLLNFFGCRWCSVWDGAVRGMVNDSAPCWRWHVGCAWL